MGSIYFRCTLSAVSNRKSPAKRMVWPWGTVSDGLVSRHLPGTGKNNVNDLSKRSADLSGFMCISLCIISLGIEPDRLLPLSENDTALVRSSEHLNCTSYADVEQALSMLRSRPAMPRLWRSDIPLIAIKPLKASDQDEPEQARIGAHGFFAAES